MKFLDEYRDAALAQKLAREIHRVTTKPWTIMEVCGGQTHAIVKFGIDELLPDKITLIHGPGCPVCVTPLEIIDKALEIAAPEAPVILKWPNDLLLGDAKLAGILLERSGERVVVGFGVNLAGSPTIEGRKTAALKPIMEVTPQAFAPLLAAKFAQLLSVWRSTEPSNFAQAWLARAHPVGTILEVHGAPGERIKGSFDGIEQDGAMRLRRDGMIDIIRSGDVLLR